MSSGQRVAARAARGVAVAALGAAVGLLVASSASASTDGEAYVVADVQCDTSHNGVLDLTLINERASIDAVFVVTDAHSSAISQFTVAPKSAAAITFTDLDDGTVAVPVAVDGVPANVAVSVSCDPPIVESAPGSAPSAAAGVASASALPAAGSSTTGVLLGAVMVAVGAAASLVSRRRHS